MSLRSVNYLLIEEEKFDIEIPDEDAERMETVTDVVKYIAKKTNRDLGIS